MNDALVSGWAAVYPHLSYRDPAAAIGFLTDAFGLRERQRDRGQARDAGRRPGDGRNALAGVDARTSPEFRQPDPPAWPHLTHSVSVAVDDVDAHHRHACARDAVILMAPTDHPWGLRTYAALDPEGHQWEFCEVLAAVAPEAWGATAVS
jgi:uncharacterized glyoxalase superfamily protein PhnB